MKLSLHLNKISLHLDKNESFVHLQDHTNFNLCYEFDKETQTYLVPFVSLPILINTIKKVKYPLVMSDVLKKYYYNTTDKRRLLNSLKEVSDLQTAENIPEIHINEIRRIQKLHGFSLSKGQEVTVAYCLSGKRVIIANDVGTGKTVTVNTVAKILLGMSKIKKVLVMLPSPLVKNYYNDYVKFFGSSGILMIKKSDLLKKRQEKYEQFIKMPNIHFLIVNYEKCYFDYELLQKLKIDMIVVDEFHNMKNFLSTKKSINFFKLVKDFWKPEYRIPMSGTPIENQLFDLFPIFKLIDGGQILGGIKFFQENFIKFEQKFTKIWSKRFRKYITLQESKATGFKNEEFLLKLIGPLIIRKKLKLPVALYKEDILIDMPSELEKAYSEVKLKYQGNPSKAYHEARQLLCDTSREGLSSNPKIIEMENIISQTDEKVVIFSFYKCTIFMLEEYFKRRGDKTLSIHGDDNRDPLDVIQEFKTSSARFLLCTDKVNFGQNIQFCRYLIQWDKPFKPTLEIQRFGRLYRTGQENDVHAYSFIIRDSVEENIFNIFNSKKELIDKTIETFNDQDLKKLENEIEKTVMSEFH